MDGKQPRYLAEAGGLADDDQRRGHNPPRGAPGSIGLRPDIVVQRLWPGDQASQKVADLGD
jgi:hypothetical protein